MSPSRSVKCIASGERGAGGERPGPVRPRHDLVGARDVTDDVEALARQQYAASHHTVEKAL
jgi:hypothetical protein